MLKQKRRNPIQRDTESGAVLVVVLMVMLGLLALGVTALWLTSGNLNVGANISQRTQALYVAEAGIERAREILINLPLAGNVPKALLDGSGPNTGCPGADADDVPAALDGSGEPNGLGAIMFDLASNQPQCSVDYPRAPNPTDSDVGLGSRWARTGQMAQYMGKYTVWIRNDTAEARLSATGLPPSPPAPPGDTWFVTDLNGAVVVRSRGIASDNRTTVILEVTLGPNLGAPNSPSVIQAPPAELCPTGKNACSENSGVVSGMVSL